MKIITSSKHRCPALALAASLLIAPAVRSDDSPPPAKAPSAAASTNASPLEPLTFLVGGEWEAKLPAQPDGQRVSILAHFTWANNHRAIHISNSYHAGDKSMPYIDGMYTWHPQKRVIVFWYVDAQGSLYEGTVKPDQGALLHEFQMTDSKGEVSQFSARQTLDGPGAWINEIFVRKDGREDPMVKVRYEKVK